jgi:hypothetical protein
MGTYMSLESAKRWVNEPCSACERCSERLLDLLADAKVQKALKDVAQFIGGPVALHVHYKKFPTIPRSAMTIERHAYETLVCAAIPVRGTAYFRKGNMTSLSW